MISIFRSRGARAGFLTVALVWTAAAECAATPNQPQFTPLVALDFNSGAAGSILNNFGAGGDTCVSCQSTYSTDIPGPFDSKPVLKQYTPAASYVFGGQITKFANMGEGQQIWVRWYEFMPASFCLANGAASTDGAAAAIKWMRFQYSNGSRVTYEPDAKGSCAAPCTACLTAIKPDFFAGEGMLWKERYGNMNYWLVDQSPTFPLGQWHALQVYMSLSAGSADKSDGTGLIRIWVDDKLVGEQRRNTLPAANTTLESIWMGNYWNGGAPRDQAWYIDELIITTNPPGTTDSGGRPFIHPETRVVDVSAGAIPPPNAPDLLVD